MKIVDELHAHTTRAVWDAINTATGARKQPLLVITTPVSLWVRDEDGGHR